MCQMTQGLGESIGRAFLSQGGVLQVGMRVRQDQEGVISAKETSAVS